MVDFLYWVAVAVVAGLILAGFGFAARWLRVEDNRIWLRQKLCRHDWYRFPEDDPGSALIVLRATEEECKKCGAQR